MTSRRPRLIELVPSLPLSYRLRANSTSWCWKRILALALVLYSLLAPCRLPAYTGLGAVNMSPSRANSLLATLFLLLACAVILVAGQDCSATKLCATGCCSAFGFCSTDTAHCGTGCLSTCDYKLGCDENNPCKDGTCCSEFGFCGLGPNCEWTLYT